MPSVPLQPPAKFNFSNPDEWPKWRRRFKQFGIASGMAGESEERQISTLLYCLGEEAEDVLTSTNISEADRGRYAQVLGKMDKFFKVRKNDNPDSIGIESQLNPDYRILVRRWIISGFRCEIAQSHSQAPERARKVGGKGDAYGASFPNSLKSCAGAAIIATYPNRE